MRPNLIALTVGEEGRLACGILLEVLLEGRVLRQTCIGLKPQQLRSIGALRSTKISIVELEPLLRPALPTRHPDPCSVGTEREDKSEL